MEQEVTLKVPAIHCESCVNSVRKALSVIPSVDVLAADTTTKEVRLSFDLAQTSLGRITEALDAIGFSPEERS